MNGSVRFGALALALATLGVSTGSAQETGIGLEPNPRRGITQVGTRGANFLHIGVSARALALSEAYTAHAEGPSGIFYNPSSIAEIEGFSVAATYSDLYGGSGITHSFGAVVLPVGQGAVGFQFINLSSGEILATTELSPEGFDPIRGESVEWSAIAVGASYARRITDRLTVGFTTKFAQEGIDFAHANYFGFDVGTKFYTGLYGITLGAALTNIGPAGRFEGPAIEGEIDDDQRVFLNRLLGHDVRFRLDTHAMQLPTAFRFGVRTDLMGTAASLLGVPAPGHNLMLLTEVSDAFDTDLQTRLGAEYNFRETLFVRAGKRFFNEDRAPWDTMDGAALGLGVRIPFLGRRIALDYAYTELGELDNVQTFSIEFGF